MRIFIPQGQCLQCIFLRTQNMLLVQVACRFDISLEYGTHEQLMLFTFTLDYSSVAGRYMPIALSLIKQTSAVANKSLGITCTYQGSME
jgi:hypothetical protein